MPELGPCRSKPCGDRITGEVGIVDDATLKAELIQLRELLSAAGVPWGLCAGAAVYLYARNRPPTDVDVLVRPRDLSAVAASLGRQSKTEFTSWGESSKIEAGKVEISGLLVVEIEGSRYLYEMDEEMVMRLREVDFGGITVPIVAPEDVIAFKAVLQRGPDQGKHDLTDIEALAGAVELDLDYLRARLVRMGAEERAKPVIAGLAGGE